MGVFSKIEGKLDDAVEGVASSVFKSPIEPAQVAKKAEKQMHREKLVGTGAQYAPTLYTVLVNPTDDKRLFGFYPTMASEIETYIMGKAGDAGYALETHPLVRFIVDDRMKSGKFDVVAELVTSKTLRKLRAEEEAFYAGTAFQDVPDDDSYADVNDDDYEGAPVAPVAPTPQTPRPQSSHTVPAARQRRRVPEYDDDIIAVLIDPSNGTEFLISSTRAEIGRDETCAICLDDSSVSRVHAEINRDDGGAWRIRDLGSTNGTKLNGKKTPSATLRSGDKISVGTTILEFHNVSIG